MLNSVSRERSVESYKRGESKQRGLAQRDNSSALTTTSIPRASPPLLPLSAFLFYSATAWQSRCFGFFERSRFSKVITSVEILFQPDIAPDLALRRDDLKGKRGEIPWRRYTTDSSILSNKLNDDPDTKKKKRKRVRRLMSRRRQEREEKEGDLLSQK